MTIGRLKVSFNNYNSVRESLDSVFNRGFDTEFFRKDYSYYENLKVIYEEYSGDVYSLEDFVKTCLSNDQLYMLKESLLGIENKHCKLSLFERKSGVSKIRALGVFGGDCYLYLFNYKNIYKVGVSVDPVSRLKHFNKHHLNEMKFNSVIYFKSRFNCERHEQIIHKLLK